VAAPSQAEIDDHVDHWMARIAEFIPASISLTTHVRSGNIGGSLRRIAADGGCDVLVLSASGAPIRRRLLTRWARRRGVRVVSV
jgi:hypothetical protein